LSAGDRMHGGPDALGVPLHDFSTNSNACGPCPLALAAVQAADASRYPDASYTALRAALADWHGVAPGRLLPAGSASEFIFRISAWVGRRAGSAGPPGVWQPQHAFGDYAAAAAACGLPRRHDDGGEGAALVWACEPSSPLGQAHTRWPGATYGGTVVLDSAYAPLRLSGSASLGPAQRDRVWQLYSPNKALGLTGVRAAYAIAPLGHEAAVAQLDALAPSWVLGSHGVAMLQAWVQAPVQGWLTNSLTTLRRWKALQIELLTGAGWTCLPSEANFFCARPPPGTTVPAWCQALRAQGIKLRDTGSFGLPGLVRLGVLPPGAQAALLAAIESVGAPV
jgi:histidinol-phosphate aminotransferase